MSHAFASRCLLNAPLMAFLNGQGQGRREGALGRHTPWKKVLSVIRRHFGEVLQHVDTNFIPCVEIGVQHSFGNTRGFRQFHRNMSAFIR